MSETGSIENLESDNEDVELNNAESGEEDQPSENINADPETNDLEISDQSKSVKPKKIIRNPQPKLNADTLRGPKGLVALESIFKDVKFKGPGHEEEDLNHLMKTYEYWCNRLFPKYPFDECISKIEKLGSKKIVQTYVKKIRLGMLDEDNNENDIVEEAEEIIEKDGWDEIFDSLSKEASTPNQVQPEPVIQQFHTTSNEEEIVLSEEVRERIRKNQEQARRIREEKLKNHQLISNNSSRVNISNNVEDMETLTPGEQHCDIENNATNSETIETDDVVNESEKNLTISDELNVNSTPGEQQRDIENNAMNSETMETDDVNASEKNLTISDELNVNSTPGEQQCDIENNATNSETMVTDDVVNATEKNLTISDELNVNSDHLSHSDVNIETSKEQHKEISEVIHTTTSLNSSSPLVSNIMQPDSCKQNVKENRKTTESDNGSET